MSKIARFGLSEEVISKIVAVLKKHKNLDKVILYGSRAKGNFKHGSDIDLALVGDKLTTEDLLKIENEIDDLLLPYKFDVSLFHTIDNQEVVDHIKRVGCEFK